MDYDTAAQARPSHCCMPERWPHGWPGYVPPPLRPLPALKRFPILAGVAHGC